MKRKIVVIALILIVSIICCGCVVEPSTSNHNFSPNKNYENNENFEDYKDYEEYEFDITYRKDSDDISPVVYVTQYGEHYHTPKCHHTKNAYMRLTVKQAWNKGYLPCAICCY